MPKHRVRFLPSYILVISEPFLRLISRWLLIKGEWVSECLNEFFNQEKLLFVGNNMTEDIGQIEFALTLLNGSTWKFTGKWLDTCVLWTSFGGWSKSVGLANFRYQTLGGFLLKHFKLSCAPDWALRHKELFWEYTVHNIGDIQLLWELSIHSSICANFNPFNSQNSSLILVCPLTKHSSSSRT